MSLWRKGWNETTWTITSFLLYLSRHHTQCSILCTDCTFSLAVFFLLLSVRSEASCMSRSNFSPSYVFFAFRFNVWLLSLSGLITVMCVRICLFHTLPEAHMCAHAQTFTHSRAHNHSVFPFTVCLYVRLGGLCLINFKRLHCVCVCLSMFVYGFCVWVQCL